MQRLVVNHTKSSEAW